MKSIPVMIIFWYLFPIVLLFASNFVISTLSLFDRFKIKSPDLATPFLLVGLNALSKDVYNESVVPYILISIFLLGIAVAFLQARRFGEIRYRRYFKMFWRLVFLVTLVVYVLVVILSLVHYL